MENTAHDAGVRVALGMPGLPPAVRDGDPSPMPDHSGLLDRFGRLATDLRVSLIDKCNLRCTYCMPANGLDWMAKDRLMTQDEIRRLVRLAVERLGVRELRLTGGEPLVRADLVEIIAGLRSDHPGLPISMTTNAVGLESRAQALRDAGLSRINVSLDSIHPETFATLTRRNFLDQVLREDKDLAFVIHFDVEVELLQDLTSSRKKLEASLGQLRTPEPGGLRRRDPGSPGPRTMFVCA